MKNIMFFSILLFTSLLYADQKMVAGIIRYQKGKWILLDSKDNHASLNVKSVETKEYSAVIHFDFKANRAFTFIVSPDEAYIKHGIMAGASAGLNSATIEFSKSGPKTKVLKSSDMAIDGSNLFFYGLFD